MDEATDRVVVLALPPLAELALGPFLRRAGLEVSTPESAEAAIELLHEVPHRLVLVGHPLPDLSVAAFATVLRSKNSASRQAGLMVLTAGPPPDDVKALLGHGLNAVLPASAPPTEIQRRAAALLAVAPRVAIRVLVKVHVTVGTGERAILAQTENLSVSGMLVRSGRHPDVGTILPIELALPGDAQPIRCNGEVVRTVDRRREGVEGFAVRFTDLQPADRLRLERAVGRTLRE